MSYDKRFFQYLIKKYYKVILILFALGFLIVPLPAMTRELVWYGQSYSYTDTYLFMTTIFACAASMILPIVVRSAFLDRKRCDRLLSLPLTSRRIYLLIAVFTYSAFLAVFTALYIILVIVNTVKGLPMSPAYAAYYGFMLIITLSIFGETSLVSSLANNVLDAVLLVISEAVASIIIAYEVFGHIRSEALTYSFFPILFANDLTTGCEYWVVSSATSHFINGFATCLFALIGRLIMGGGAFALSLLETGVYKSEKAGDVSDKWYSYKLINTLLFALIGKMLLRNLDLGIGSMWLILFFFLVAFFLISEFIYQRKIRITKGLLLRLVTLMAGSGALYLLVEIGSVFFLTV